MWSRISGALKRSTTGDEDPHTNNNATVNDTLTTQHPEVVSTILNPHPNMSVFQTDDDDSAQPPMSPSIPHFATARRAPSAGPEDTEGQSTFKLSLRIPKKLKNLTGNDAPLSAARRSIDAQSAFTGAQEFGGPDSPSPITPATDNNKFGSLRSILRNKEAATPGTAARSVRFFSKLAQQETSMSSTTDHDPSFPGFEDLDEATQKQSKRSISRHSQPPRLRAPPRSVVDLFPGPTISTSATATGDDKASLSSFSPVPPPEMSNIFDMSADGEPPAIAHKDGMMDNAVELNDNADTETEDVNGPAANDETINKRQMRHQSFPALGFSRPSTQLERPASPASPKSSHDRSHSFSFGQTVFFSASRSVSSNSDPLENSPSSEKGESAAPKPLNRTRAQGETIFGTLAGGPSTKPPPVIVDNPEADINDNSQLQIWAAPEPDPFAADARTYFTPDTRIPQTPPQAERESFLPLPDVGPSGAIVAESIRNGANSRASSRDESVVQALRAELAVQEEVRRQFEIDLAARDELVSALRERLTTIASEAEARKNALRGWKKKVQELERACRYLEEEVDRSNASIAERSVLEEASSEALRMLHVRINALEKEKTDVEREAYELRRQMAARPVSILREDIDGEERAALEQRLSDVEVELAKAEDEKAILLRESEERKSLLESREEQLEMFKAELEAQWQGTEKNGEKLDALRKDRDMARKECEMLQRTVSKLEQRVTELSTRCEEAENDRNKLKSGERQAWDGREELERHREELERQLYEEQQQTEELTIALQEREDRITELQEETRYAQDTITRLEENLRTQEQELESYAARVRGSEENAEGLLEQLSKASREHRRVVEENRRELDDAQKLSAAAQTQMADLIRTKAEADIQEAQLKERNATLEQELERLRRQVHEMQQESAAKDLRVTQLIKQRSQDKEDMQGLNIALDSKQQELELFKRKAEKLVAVGGLAASTTSTVASKTKPDHKRRQSSISSTTSIFPPPRPTSAMSDTSSASKESSTSTMATPVGRMSTLARSSRVNSLSSAATTLASGASTVKKANRMSVAGSLGAPPAMNTAPERPRVSSATQSISTRLAAAKVPPSGKPSASGSVSPTSRTHRRVSSALSNSSFSASDREMSPGSPSASEKENAPTPRARRPGVPLSAV